VGQAADFFFGLIDGGVRGVGVQRDTGSSPPLYTPGGRLLDMTKNLD